jgi:hypothetical protein
MSPEEFEQSLQQKQPPASLPALLKALWYDAKGQWESAHDLTQDDDSPEGSWVHAYLHRKEGDKFNAAYWYRKANRPHYQGSLEQEWKDISRTLLPS